MAFKKGQTGNPKGRPKGSLTTRQKALNTINDRVMESLAAGTKATPLEILMKYATDPKESKTVRIQAAGLCLPYLHSKKATEAPRSINNGAGGLIVVPADMSDADWEAEAKKHQALIIEAEAKASTP